jgi:hypothetical protein
MFFATMLTNPRYQANCVRLEALVHLSLITADGTALPSLRALSQCLHDLGEGHCGLMEDPTEDLFVGNVIAQNRNFRVIEGLWESGSFYLQRFMDVLESTPAEPPFIRLRQSTIAILQLSDALCERAGLNRYHAGEEFPQDLWPEEELSAHQKRTCLFQQR